MDEDLIAVGTGQAGHAQDIIRTMVRDGTAAVLLPTLLVDIHPGHLLGSGEQGILPFFGQAVHFLSGFTEVMPDSHSLPPRQQTEGRYSGVECPATDRLHLLADTCLVITPNVWHQGRAPPPLQ